MGMMKFGMGQSLTRVEDQRFITGQGRYATDVSVKGELHAFVLRSPHAHARFSFRDLSTAGAMPGVQLILTHEDIAHLGPLPCGAITRVGAHRSARVPTYSVLPKDRVVHVGEAIAFVVAETLLQARDAAEAILIDWQPQAVAADLAAARAAGAPVVHPEAPDNIAFESILGKKEPTDAAFAKAHRVVSLDIVNSRLVANYMEPRSVVAEAKGEKLTLTLGSQGSHGLRDTLAKAILKIDPANVRVITPDVGGGFGTKTFMYREYPLAAVAAQKSRRPVRWVSDRSEHFFACAHGRDNLTHAEMALDEKGRFLAIRVRLDANMGGYLSQFGPFIPWIGSTMLSGCYRIPVGYTHIRGFFSHSVPVDAYRGAGRPEAAFVVERLVDYIADEIGMDRVALRKLNLVKAKEMPYRTPTDRLYDSGDFTGHMLKALENGDWKGFPARLKTSRKAGKLRGIGFGCYIEACGGGGAEPGYVTLEKDGSATVRIGTQSNGQGHETAYAQLVAEHLDIPLSRIRVLQGDTDGTPTGSGTGGSRSIPVGGAGVAAAAKTLAENLKALAGEALEAAPGDLEIVDGTVRIAGTDRKLSFSEIAALPKARKAMLSTTGSFTPPEATYPNGTHLAEVEIDPTTGEVTILRFVVVDDYGVTLNPLLLAGQLHGGAVQGIGQITVENYAIDANGQLLTASFLDYAMPRADQMPHIEIETRNIPCTTNALGIKGAGEAGTIGAAPAVMNAIVDALRRGYGIRHFDMPATPQRVWAAIQQARKT